MSAPVTIVVVSWNTCSLLDRCLASMRPEHAIGRADVVVVDNGSTDGSVDLVREEHPWTRLIERTDNPGYGVAVNAGAAGTDSRWIVAANADVEVAPGALGRLLDAATDDPHAGILAPRLRTPEGACQHSVHPFPGIATAAAVELVLPAMVPRVGRRLALEGAWDDRVPRTVDWAHGAFLAISRDAWRATGGFDPAMWMYAEDLDLCWRARRAGFTTRYVPAADVVHHVSAATSQAFGDERFDRAQAAAYRWMCARIGRPRAAAIAGLGMTGAAARSGLLVLPERVRPQTFGWRRERARRFGAAHRAGLGATLRGAGR